MAKLKIYECCICHKILTEYKPIRLVRQKYGKGNYKQYANVCNYDFCINCYKRFNSWIMKNKREEK